MYQCSLEIPSSRPSSRRGSRSEVGMATEIRCSQQSILNAMDRFVKAVANMDSTVLVPSRLRDLDATSGKVTPPSSVRSGDLHILFTTLHDIRKELLWGGPGSHTPGLHLFGGGGVGGGSVVGGGGSDGRDSSAYKPHHEPQYSHGPSLRVPSMTSLQGSHKRHLSTGSVASAISDADTDLESLCDFVEGDYGAQLASSFRLHLQGLHSILQQLADSADFLAERYLEDIEPTP